MIENTQHLTLDRTATYQIQVPGAIDKDWLNWNGGLTIIVESDRAGTPISTLSIQADQAALHGLLRHLYSLGLPLISVIWVEPNQLDSDKRDGDG
jgi:hypothetical protein